MIRLNPKSHTLKLISLFVSGVSISIGFNARYKHLQELAKSDALVFAKEHRLGGSLLNVGRNLVWFHHDQAGFYINQGMILGVSLAILIVVILWLFCGKTLISKSELFSLKNKASQWDLQQVMKGTYRETEPPRNQKINT